MSSLDTQERKESIRERKSRGGAKSDFFHLWQWSTTQAVNIVQNGFGGLSPMLRSNVGLDRNLGII